ncbi:hypothetical protein B1L11_13680 [Microbispora sp. GKU 823]|nr:hypothetical protein B1L11_13680 [Microbispora sp. GKU 823]
MRRSHRPGDIVRDDRGEALELCEEIGSGGQGTVWSLKGGQAAVKFVESGAGDDLRLRIAAVRRFDLSGVPIARPLSLLVGDDIGYTMELLAEMTGIGTLIAVPHERQAEWFHATGGLRRRLRLLARAAEALDRIHSKGLAYGDVSPGNVLVSARSENDQVWLIDPDNLSVQARLPDAAYVTEDYAAPELLTGQAGPDSLTDVFAFAVLAFHTLALTHPFIGDMVDRDAGLEVDAFRGRLPWIDHQTDDRNRSSQGLSRQIALTKGLRRLAAQTFEEGLHRPERRPSMRDWHDKLDQAALLMIACPGCGGTYHAAMTGCPWCRRESRPPVLRCDLHGYLPAGKAPEIPDEAETERLRSIILASGQPQTVRARTGLLCLDRGPSGIATDPGEPLVDLNWDGGRRVLIHRVGRHPVWMVNRRARSDVPLDPGDIWPLNLNDTADWTVHFGPPAEPHRLLRILLPRTEA